MRGCARRDVTAQPRHYRTGADGLLTLRRSDYYHTGRLMPLDRPEPPRTWKEIDLTEVIAKGAAACGGRLVMNWRGFWIVRRNRCPLKVVYQSARKDRKF